jgi:5-methylcytosine-specific restriction endonuclease McrA
MKTLVLNIDYTPLSTINVRRALILTFKRNVKVVAYYEKEFKSEKDSYKIPAVIVCEKYINRPTRRSPTRHSVLQRDRMICQYCNEKLNYHNATVDHVIPVSMYKRKNDANTWENMVACCKKCNTKKGDKTPHQAGMKLLSKPRRPFHFLLGVDIPKEWEEYTNGAGI